MSTFSPFSSNAIFLYPTIGHFCVNDGQNKTLDILSQKSFSLCLSFQLRKHICIHTYIHMCKHIHAYSILLNLLPFTLVSCLVYLFKQHLNLSLFFPDSWNLCSTQKPEWKFISYHPAYNYTVTPFSLKCTKCTPHIGTSLNTCLNS